MKNSQMVIESQKAGSHSGMKTLYQGQIIQYFSVTLS